ncbi:hypothetical protein AHF37_09334, partial [Paragonimus kellicotti]
HPSLPCSGNTALHDCAESGNLKGLQLLLEHHAIMRRDEYGQSPIMSGANAAFKKARFYHAGVYFARCDSTAYTAVVVYTLYLALHRFLVSIVDYLTALSDSLSCDSSEVNISVHEKIAAYELLGASLFDRHSLVQDAIAAWFQALKLRQLACTYPKQVLSVNPQCLCPVLDSFGAADNNLPEYSSASGSRRGSSEVFGTNWSLVSLAAREAVHMSESAHNVRAVGVPSDNSSAGLICASCCRAEPPLPEGCAVFRDASLAADLYTAKQIALQNELYAAYLKELRHTNFPANSLPSRPPGFGSHRDLVDGRWSIYQLPIYLGNR